MFDSELVGDDVGPTVAVQVGDGHRGRRHPDRYGLAGAEAAVTVAEMDGHRVLVDVGGDDVEVAVAGQVGRPPRNTFSGRRP